MKLPKVHLSYPKVALTASKFWISLNHGTKLYRVEYSGHAVQFRELPQYQFCVCKMQEGYSFTEVVSGRRVTHGPTSQLAIIRGIAKLEATLSFRGVAWLEKVVLSVPKVKTLTDSAPTWKADQHTDHAEPDEEVAPIKF